MMNERLEAVLRERFDCLPHRPYDVFAPNHMQEIVVGVRWGADPDVLWEFCEDLALNQQCVILRLAASANEFHSSYIYLTGVEGGEGDDLGF